MGVNNNFLEVDTNFKTIKKVLLFSLYLSSFILIFDFFLLNLRPWTALFLLLYGSFLIFFYQMFLNLQYTFWTFSVFFAAFWGYKILFYTTKFHFNFLGASIFMSVIFLTACYLLYSPIYYPKVRWWEYDFRFREDVKAFFSLHNRPLRLIECRVTDFRRNSGCVVSFEDLNSGEIIEFKIPYQEKILSPKAKIITKREYLLGRGKTYGISFIFKDEADKITYKDFSQFWSNRKKTLIQKKFVAYTNYDENSNPTSLL